MCLDDEIERIILDMVFTHQIILVYEDHELAIPQVGEPRPMPGRRRRSYSWTRNYMKEYRQGKLRGDITDESTRDERREKLKEAHRLDSFKWRLSKLLGSQYEILLCVQYERIYRNYKSNNGRIDVVDTGSRVKDVLEACPILKSFKACCSPGGSEIFKAFVLSSYGRKYNGMTPYVVGVLDKAALLKNLRNVPKESDNDWDRVITKVETKAREEIWRELDFSGKIGLWLGNRVFCQPLKWTIHKDPKWASSQLHELLHRWVIGNRKIRKREWEEERKANKCVFRLIISPILRRDEIA
jgi:hypothetical protein